MRKKVGLKKLLRMCSVTAALAMLGTSCTLGTDQQTWDGINQVGSQIQAQEKTTSKGDDAKMDYFKQLQTSRIQSDPNVEWVQFGPGSAGGAPQKFYHPTDSNTLFSFQNMNNSYRSTDGLSSVRTWQTILDYDGYGVNPENLTKAYGMDFSRQDPNFGMAVNVHGLWVTNTKGASWERTSRELFKGANNPSLSAVAFDPNNDHIIYVGSGNFWRNKDMRTKAHPYGEPGQIQTPGTIWKTTDKGATWNQLNQGINPSAEIGAIFVHPGNASILYAATSRGFYYSGNAGQTWELRTDGMANGVLRDADMYYDQQSNQTILYALELTDWTDQGDGTISSPGGVYKSTDHGATWVQINGNLSLDLTTVKDNRTVDNFYKYMASWFNITLQDAKNQFKLPTSILPSFRELEVNPQDPNKLYLVNSIRKDNSIGFEGVWMSEDGGINWFLSTRIGSGFTSDTAYWNSRYAPGDVTLASENLEVGAEKHWSWLFTVKYPTLAYQYMDVSPDGNTLTLHAFKSSIASKDNGRSWKQIDSIETSPGSNVWVGRGDSNMPGKRIYVQPNTNKLYFTSGENGTWVIRENEELPDASEVPAVTQVDPVNVVASPSTIAFDPNNESIVYALQDRLNDAGHFMKSVDGGRTWTSLVKLFDIKIDEALKQYSLIINKDNPDTMYFAVPAKVINDADNAPKDMNKIDSNPEYGVYKTTDGGHSWKTVNNGLPAGASVNSIAFDQKNSSILYAAVLENNKKPGGLYKTDNGGEMWTKVMIPESIIQVNQVHIAHNGNIYIACGTEGGTIEAGGVWVSANDGKNWGKLFHMPYVFQAVTDTQDGERILVNVAAASTVSYLNPGVYVTQDGGKSWSKINTNLGTPSRVVDVKFDPKNRSVIWCTLLSSGLYKANLNKVRKLDQ
jgi:photosystem II stability/assembly factor-like uncharacterized protein